MEAVSAPEIDQDKIEAPPGVTEAGTALNEAMTGAVLEQATAVVGVRVMALGPVAVKVT